MFQAQMGGRNLRGLGMTGGNVRAQTGGVDRPPQKLQSRARRGGRLNKYSGRGTVGPGRGRRGNPRRRNQAQKVSRFRGRRGQGNTRRLKGLLGGAAGGRGTIGSRAQAGGNVRKGGWNRRGNAGRGTIGGAAGRGTVGPKRNNLHQIASQLRGAF